MLVKIERLLEGEIYLKVYEKHFLIDLYYKLKQQKMEGNRLYCPYNNNCKKCEGIRVCPIKSTNIKQ